MHVDAALKLLGELRGWKEDNSIGALSQLTAYIYVSHDWVQVTDQQASSPTVLVTMGVSDSLSKLGECSLSFEKVGVSEQVFSSLGEKSPLRKNVKVISIPRVSDPVVTTNSNPIPPRCFIVHGHDSDALYQLKNYLQNTLELGQPVVLREQPSDAMTLIEKFEAASGDVDLVFVLLTPDDVVRNTGASDSEKHRSRQNVILELGLLYRQIWATQGPRNSPTQRHP